MAAVLPYLPYIVAGVGGLMGNLSGANAAKQNAQIAKQEGNTAAALGEVKAGMLSRRNRLLTSEQIAGYSSSGLDLAGTPTDVMASDAVQGELDALMANYEGQAARQAKMYESKQYRYEGKQDKLRSVFDPAGIIIKSAGVKAANTAPTIQPGGSTSGAAWAKGYNAPDLKSSEVFG